MLNKIFSIKNEYKNNKKYKVVTIFGIKIKFSLKNNLNRLISNEINNIFLENKYEDIIENILYYIHNSNIVRPKILNEEATIDLLCNSNKSIARFGDGEILLTNGYDISYQEYNQLLGEKFREILKLNNNNNVIIGINHWYFYPKLDTCSPQLLKDFQLNSMPKFRKELLKLIDLDAQYCDAGFTALKEKYNDDFFEKIRSIWEDKDIILVANKELLSHIEYNIFDNSKTIEYIYVPNINSFSEYENVSNILKNTNKSLIILCAGPLSKILVYDIASENKRLLDLGHILKLYDYYKKGYEYTSESIKEFNSKE